MNDFFPFLLLTLFIVLSPGIDTALITKRTIADGRQHGYKMALGITTGTLVHTCAAAFGLSVVLMQSALAFEIVKYIGAIYLIYLGASSFFQANKQGKMAHMTKQDDQTRRRTSAYKQGLMSNVLNPKVALFYLTFLPQFVSSSSAIPVTAQLMMMGIIHTVLSITWFLLYVCFINYLRNWLMSANVQRMMDKATGGILIGFGIKLALEKQQ
ncbi:LysE family translocator [Alkalihalobacillus oceani]|uniref:LysE family translocator n=1 Tax=Halalkalibacter oceani TaxID=1653776 RepID=UPI00203C47F0|nr:LysE family translocator [Halalkalibacter oceani]MCM3761950.1 LysE family translocator [Halalkalibacter oceani]